jgi:hypothetical protein
MIVFFSILLCIIGLRYTYDPGFIISKKGDNIFYSTELLSGGGDDFHIFKLNIILNFILGFIGILNIIIKLFSREEEHFLYIVYTIFFFIQFLILWLINLDIDLLNTIKNGDTYFVVWMIVYIIGFIIVNISRIIIKNKSKNYCA